MVSTKQITATATTQMERIRSFFAGDIRFILFSIIILIYRKLLSTHRDLQIYLISMIVKNISIRAILLILISFVSLTEAAALRVLAPKQLRHLFPNGISVHISPIGFRPLSGKLEGRALPSSPIGACSQIQDVHSENEDIFILSDDSQCLQSVKAHNIASSGGYAAIIKQNINNTLHDKEVNMVHIPVVEVKPEQFDQLMDFINNNTQKSILLSLDFNDYSQTHRINFQVWFSPTEINTYKFLFEIKTFLTDQEDIVSFRPHYVLQSQREAKNYIGCLSAGRYCPTEIQFEGKYEGKNIVEEILRQIIIWKMSSSLWWAYTALFYKNCLIQGTDLFLNSAKLQYCSQNSMIMAGVDEAAYRTEYNNSFMGPNKEVAQNTYLLEERQAYTREQLKSHPIGFLNKKQISLQVVPVEDRICKMQGKNQSSTCKSKHSLSTSHAFIIIIVMGLIFLAISAVYRMYMHFRMKTEIKSEVDKTLEQYYRYIQTFEGENGQVADSSKTRSMKQKSRQLTQQLQECPNIQENAEVEMAPIEK